MLIFLLSQETSYARENIQYDRNYTVEYQVYANYSCCKFDDIESVPSRISYIPERTEKGNSEPKLQDGILKNLGIEPSPLDKYITYNKMRELGLSQNDFLGINDSKRQDIVDKICVKLYRGLLRFSPGQIVDDIGKKLRYLVDGVLISTGNTKITRRLHQYLCAEACSAWMLSNIFRDMSFPSEFGSETKAVKYIISMDQPRCICSGKAFLLRDLSNACALDIGLKCECVGGWYRDPGMPVSIFDSNHAWNVFTLDGNIKLPCDVMGDIEDKPKAKTTIHKIGRISILPINPAEVQYFGATHFGVIKPVGQANRELPDKNPKDSFFDMRLSDWCGSDTRIMKPIFDYYLPYIR